MEWVSKRRQPITRGLFLPFRLFLAAAGTLGWLAGGAATIAGAVWKNQLTYSWRKHYQRATERKGIFLVHQLPYLAQDTFSLVLMETISSSILYYSHLSEARCSSLQFKYSTFEYSWLCFYFGTGDIDLLWMTEFSNMSVFLTYKTASWWWYVVADVHCIPGRHNLVRQLFSVQCEDEHQCWHQEPPFFL